MGLISDFSPVKLFTGILYPSNLSLNTVIPDIESTFNLPISTCSIPIPFSHTNYYEKEMGSSLNRLFVGFSPLICPSKAYTFKQLSNQLEEQHSTNNRRQINLDPGYITMHNIILFSTKNFSHRIPCAEGVYAELTALYTRKSLQSLAWTYPDFSLTPVSSFFLHLRKQYHHELRSR